MSDREGKGRAGKGREGKGGEGKCWYELLKVMYNLLVAQQIYEECLILLVIMAKLFTAKYSPNAEYCAIVHFTFLTIMHNLLCMCCT